MRDARLVVALVVAGLAGGGCGTVRPALRAELRPLDLRRQPAATLEDNLFKRDGSGSISEEDLKRVLAAPVILKAGARLGIVQVASRYEPDADLPLAPVTGELSRALEGAGIFDVATEMSTDWPADRGISGLRELAARYRSEYLLLYRHRFVDRSWTNAWGWAYLTVVGALMVPAHTLETAGVLEATLFDVRTGSILFTVFERVGSTRTANVWHNDLKRRAMQERLLARAAGTLADRVVARARKLVARRPTPAMATPTPPPAPPPAPPPPPPPAPVVAPG
jgi:hypothetical protein